MTTPYIVDWVKQTALMNTAGLDVYPSIVSDSDGSVYVTYAANVNGFDIVVMKLDNNGTVVWFQKNASFNTEAFDYSPKIAVNSEGVYVTYQTNGTVPGDGNTYSGGLDIVVFKLNKSDGTFVWAKQNASFNTLEPDYTPSIAADSEGVYVTYQTQGTVPDDENTNSGSDDIAVMKMTNEGVVDWIKQTPSFNTDNTDYAPSIAVNSEGVYVTYFTNGTVPGGENTIYGQLDIVVMKMKKDGTVEWVKQTPSFNTSADDIFPSIAADSEGVYVTYQTQGTVEGNGNTLSGRDDIAVMKMTNEGVVAWVKQTDLMNTPSGDYYPSIAVDSTGVYITYQTIGTVSGGVINSAENTIVVMKLAKVEGQVVWVQQTYRMNSSGTSNVNPTIAANSDGSLYVTYTTGGTVLGDGNTNSGGADIVVMKMIDPYRVHADPYVVDWIKQTPSFNTLEPDYTPSIAVNSEGVYVTYTTQGTVLGDGNTFSGGYEDIAVMKMTNEGAIDWIKQTPSFNTSERDNNPSIAADSTGVYVTYSTQGTVEGNGNTNSDGFDIAVMKMTNEGAIDWIKQTPLMNTIGDDITPSIAVDSTDIYVTYSTKVYNTPLIAEEEVPGRTEDTNLSPYYVDIVVMKMTKEGVVEWNKQTPLMNTYGDDINPSIAVNSDGVYVTYQTGGGTAWGANTNSGNDDIVVLKMNKNGTFGWIKQNPSFNTSGNDTNPSIAADSTGVYVTYGTGGTVSGSGNTSSGNYDIVVMKMTNTGVVDWIKQTPSFNTSADDIFPSIATDENNYIYVTYTTQGTVSGSGNTSSGNYDIVVMKMLNTGGIIWIKQNAIFNTSGNDTSPSIVANSDGSIYVTYQTDSTVSGDGNTFSGSSDIVVMKMKEPATICLLEGTLVRTPTGSVPIELVKKGDYVLNQHYKPVRVVLTSKTTFQYKTDPTSEYDLNNVLYTIPAGTLGATSNVYLTKHHKFMTSDGTMKKPEEYGLKRSELSEVCKTSDLYTVCHLRLEDEYNNHFIVNGDCIVEDWWDWPRPNVV